ncbi:MAG: hypothetical protein ACXVGH_03645 [Mycobacteriales bacterium]
MTRRGSLQDLDARLLPRAAARLGRLAASLRVRRDRAREVRPAGVRSLRALDARYAAHGPLALVREVPQLGFVVIAAVFLAGTGTVLSRENADRQRADQQTVQAPAPQASALPGEEEGQGDTALGPEVGSTVKDYLAQADAGLRAAAAGRSRAPRTALVSLTSYLSPGQAEKALAGVQVLRVYLRAPAGGKEAAQLPVDVRGDLAGTLTAAYAKARTGRLAAQKAYQGYVDSLQVVTKEDQAFKDLYASFARSTAAEAKAYGSACACVYAAVVSAPPQQLVALRARSGVRGVEVAAKGLGLSVVQLLPLLPEVKGVVPQQQAAQDPP